MAKVGANEYKLRTIRRDKVTLVDFEFVNWFFVIMSEVVKYSLEEVAKNNGKDSNKVWIIVRNNVYDVTEYLDEVNVHFY